MVLILSTGDLMWRSTDRVERKPDPLLQEQTHVETDQDFKLLPLDGDLLGAQ